MVCYIAVMLRLFLVVLLSLVAVVLTSCDSGTLNPPPEGYDPEGRCSAGKNQILPEEEWDSLQARCDTVFIRDTVIVYGDTAYEDTVVTKHDYIGFKYFDRFLDDYDTLVIVAAIALFIVILIPRKKRLVAKQAYFVIASCIQTNTPKQKRWRSRTLR